ncbi:MAG TPA: sugar transferase [Streptosporangiaceae bacterium]|jgi:exopolysaccharide biosynthesis polyprenyl glycosylphosphotransferase
MAVTNDVFSPALALRMDTTYGWEKRYIARAIVVDSLCALIGALVGFGIRFDTPDAAPFPNMALGVGLPIIWPMLVALSRGYAPGLLGVGSEEFRRLLNAAIGLTATVAVLAYATKTEISRGYVLLAIPLAAFLNLVARYVMRKRLHLLRARGQCMRRVVAVGHRAAVTALIRQFRREPYHGMGIVAACVPTRGGEGLGRRLDGVPVMGHLADASRVVRLVGADTVAVLACPEMDGAELRQLAWQLEKTGTDLCVAPALLDVAGPRTTIRPVAGLPLIHVDHPELVGAKRLVKNVFDRIAATVALLFLVPVFLVIAVLVKVTSPGPVLFRQTRVGKDGAEFRMLKFRTMVHDAEQLKNELTTQNETDGVLFKIKSDPRVTRVGSCLRRYSLDELPQLINVMLGEMSLVGPRPPLPEEAAQYGRVVRRRLVVKPGMTGLWQISGRSDLAWDEAVRLDLQYVENWSLALDMLILWKTVAAVIRGSGAY